MSSRSRLWDAGFVVGGVFLAGLTLRTYLSFDEPSGQPSHQRISSQDADRTISSAKSFLASNPEDFNAWSQLGIAYFYKGKDSYPDALNALEKARSLGATSESLFYYAGVMYEALGLPEYALNETSKYLRHHPEDYESQIRQANLLAQQKKTEEAYKLYQVLVKKWPNDPTLWFNLGLVSKEKGDLDGASSSFSKVLQIAKQLPEGGLFQQGEIMRLKGSDDQAISFYQQELNVHPQYLPALSALESAQRRKGLWKEARETRKKISDLKPS